MSCPRFIIVGASTLLVMWQAASSDKLSTRIAFGSAAVAQTSRQLSDFFPFPAELVRIVENSSEARGFTFRPSTDFGPERTVKGSVSSEAAGLNPLALDQLRKLLFSADSYEPIALQKACAFDPAFGFRFQHGRDHAWWLVSTRCGTGMLVTESTEWRRSATVVIKPAALKAFERFMHN